MGVGRGRGRHLAKGDDMGKVSAGATVPVDSCAAILPGCPNGRRRQMASATKKSLVGIGHAVPIPAQWTRGGSPPPPEVEWNEAIEAAKPILPGDIYGRLVDASAGRAIGAYDFGVAWGIGQIPDVDTDAPTEVIFAGVQAAMERLTELTAILNERIQ